MLFKNDPLGKMPCDEHQKLLPNVCCGVLTERWCEADDFPRTLPLVSTSTECFTTLYINPIQASTFGDTFGQFFLRIFYAVFTEDAFLLFLNDGAKYVKHDQKLKSRAWGSCLDLA